jgi:hypothetical protein
MASLTLDEPSLTFGARLASRLPWAKAKPPGAINAARKAAKQVADARYAEALAFAQSRGWENAEQVAADAVKLLGEYDAKDGGAIAAGAPITLAARRDANAAGVPTDVPAPKPAATKKAWTATYDGKVAFASDSPALALQKWTTLLREARGDSRKTPRLVNTTEETLQKAAAAASAGKESQADTPEAVLTALNISSHWDGRGIQYSVVAGVDDQWRCETNSWKAAITIGKECESAGDPVTIRASHGDAQATFFKHGQGWQDRFAARLKVEEIEAKAKSANATKEEAAKNAEKATAQLAALSALATQRSGIALSLVAPDAPEAQPMAAGAVPQTKEQLEAALAGKSFEEKHQILRAWDNRNRWS